MKIQLGYTPTAADAYMLFGLLRGAIDVGQWDIEPTEASLQALNDRASRGQLDATMISAATYPLVRDRYVLLAGGSCFGLGAGPRVVSREALDGAALAEAKIAVPGVTSTAYAMLQLYNPALRTCVLPLDKLLPAVETGLVQCALVIHEEFITYSQLGMHVVIDLGQWWAEQFGGLPMPVTNCVVRRSLPDEVGQWLASAVRQSVRYSLAHHVEAMTFARQYAQGADLASVESFVRQYVNELSENMGPQGRKSLETFFERTARVRILPPAGPLEIL